MPAAYWEKISFLNGRQIFTIPFRYCIISGKAKSFIEENCYILWYSRKSLIWGVGRCRFFFSYKSSNSRDYEQLDSLSPGQPH